MSYNNPNYLPRKPSFITTSSSSSSSRPPHHRPEDAQPSEAITSNRRPTAPPQLVPIGQYQQQAQQAQLERERVRQQQQGQAGRAGGWANPLARGGANGRGRGGGGRGRGGGGGPNIHPGRLNRGKTTTAGSWADAPTPPTGPRGDRNGNSSGKGKERETDDSPAGSGSGGEGGAGGGGYVAFLAAKGQAHATPIAVPQNPRATLYVKGLPGGVTEEQVRSVFEKYGAVERVSVNHQSPTYAYAHVVFTHPTFASAALYALNCEPFPLPVASTSTSTSTTSTSSSSTGFIPQQREMHIQYSEPDHSRRVSGGAGQAAFPATSSWLEGGGYEETNAALFRARETPVPSSMQQQQQNDTKAVKREPEGSPVKPAAALPAPSSSSAPPSRPSSSTPSFPIPDAPLLRTPSHQALHASHPLSTPYESSRSVFTSLYPLPVEYHPTSTHSGLIQAVRRHLREDRPDVLVYRHGFEGNGLRLVFAIHNEGEGESGGRGEREWNLGERLRRERREVEREAQGQGQGQGEELEPRKLGKKARRNLRKREAKRREEEERAKGRGVEIGASGGLVVEEEEEEEEDDGDEEEEDAMDISEGEGGANGDDEEVDELDEDDDGDAAVQQLLRPSSRATVVDNSQPPTPIPAASTSVSISAFPSSHTSACRPPSPPPAPAPAATTTAPTSVSLDDDGTQYERVPLPPACLAANGNGNGRDAAAQRRRFLVEQVKRLHGEGKVVLSNSIEGDFLVLNYLVDESSAPPPASAPTPQPAAAAQPPAASASFSIPAVQDAAAPPPSLSRTITTSTARHLLADLHLPSSGSGSPAPAAGPSSLSAVATVDVEMEDIKPVVPPSPVRSGRREETDQLATPAPSEPEVPPARFPMKMQGSSNVDRKDTFTIVSPFLNLYYQRFDSSRASLESMYTSDAIFSLRISPTVPPRARSPVVPFSKKWLLAAQKPSSITPTSITNAIRELPAGSTDLDKIIFTARAVPEMGGSVYGPASSSNAGKKRPTYPPILLHLTGEFEEFPEKVVRRFARTFILVPKSPRFGTGTDGPEYWIRSDQLTVLYRVEGEPRALPLQEKLFEAQAPRKRSASAGLPPGAAAAGGGRAPPVVQAVAANGSTGGTFNPFANFAFGGQGAQFQPHASTSRQQPQQQPAPTARPVPIPAAAHPSTSTSTPAAPAPRPAAAPAASSALARVPSSDCIILSDSDSVASASVGASRSPELARRPAPLPQQQPASSKSLGKRRAAELSDSDVAIAGGRGGGANGSSPAAVRAAQRQRTSLSTASSSSSSIAAAAAEQAEADRLGVSTDTLRLMVEREVAAQVAKLAGGAAPGSGGKGKKADGGASGDKGKGGKAVKGKDRAVEKGKDGGAAGKASKGKNSGKEKEKDVPLGTGLGPSDGRIIIPAGPSNSQLHTFDGRGNKLRHMIRVTPSSFLAVSFLGDVAEFSLSPDTPLASTRILQKNQGDDRFRVDEAAWSESKETLVVGYLGAKEPGVKELRQPPNQVVLYKREEHPHTGLTSLVDTPVAHKPHAYGGVTSVATLSGGGRLRFVTAGEDKKLFLWTRQRSTQALTTEDIRSQHSSTITSLAHLPDHNYIVSASKDKRLIAHDLSSQSSVWQALLPHPVMTVQTLTVDPNLVLARMGSPSNQFSIHDIRQSATAAPVLTFGIDLQPHRHGTSGALTPTNMGRYIRGEMCDSIFAFPDHEQGVKLWDLRNVRTAALNPSSIKRQHLQNIGRSKVVQAAFAGRDQLCLMELNHFTRVPIRG